MRKLVSKADMEAHSVRRQHWRRWFAWRPVWVENDIAQGFVWLEYVYRRWVPSSGMSCYEESGRYEYQLKVEDITT